MLVNEVEHAGDAFVMAVGEEGVGRQIRHALLDWVRDYTACARDRLPAAFEHERETHRQPRAVRPEVACVAGRRIDGRGRGADGTGQAAGSGGGGECDGLKSLSTIEVRGLLRGIYHRVHLVLFLSISRRLPAGPGGRAYRAVVFRSTSPTTGSRVRYSRRPAAAKIKSAISLG